MGDRPTRTTEDASGGDKGLQGVRMDYRNFFLTRTFPDTFSWSILHKNQSLKTPKCSLGKQITNFFYIVQVTDGLLLIIYFVTLPHSVFNLF